MAGKYRQYENGLNGFNNRYKVDFSFEKYASQSLREKNLAPALKGVKGISKENLAYRNALLNLYHQCVENMMKGTYRSFDPARLASDFEALMNNYRDYCNDKNKRSPEPNGGWKSGVDTMDAMRQTLDTINAKKSDYFVERYKAGRVSLEEMRSEIIDTVKKGRDNATLKEIANINVYKEALEKIVESRTVWTRLNPLNWYSMARENYHLKLFDEASNYFLENMVASESEMEDPFKDRADEALTKAGESIQAKEQTQEKENALNNEPTRVQENLDFLSERNQKTDIVPKIQEEDKAIKKENTLQA